MEQENPENSEKSKEVDVETEDQTTEDNKNDKDLGNPTSDIKLKTEDERVQQTETVTVQEESTIVKAKTRPYYPGAVVENPGPDNREIMRMLQSIQQQLNALTTTVANIQRDAVPPRQPAIAPPPPGPLAVDGLPLQPPGNELLQIGPAECGDLEIAGASGSNELAIMLPRPLAIGPPPVENRLSSESFGLGIQGSQAGASIPGIHPALPRGSNADPVDDDQPPETQRPSDSLPSVISVRSAAPRRSNLDRCNAF
ncbi:uncharacterized protein LOC120347874 isoform X1 [Styela clava]